jgi:phospholipase A1
MHGRARADPANEGDPGLLVLVEIRFFRMSGSTVTLTQMRLAWLVLIPLAVADLAAAQSTVGPPTAQAPPPPKTLPPPPGDDSSGPAAAAPSAVQRPEEPVVPGASAAPEPPLQLEYVPGYRAILTGHQENYFITGVSKKTQVKFQFSAKFDLWPNASRHSVYFGFTQKSFWRLYDTSSPFQENDYAPELFYGYFKRAGDIVPQPGRTLLFVQNARVGFEHESNGVDGASSRSWNRVYGYVRAGVYLGTDHYFTLAPQVWRAVKHGPLGLDDNPDIIDYLGHGASAGTWGLQGYAQWRPGYRGSVLRWFKFTPYLYAQLYSGYGESLLLYNQKATSFRLGIALEDKVNWKTVAKTRQPPDADDGGP